MHSEFELLLLEERIDNSHSLIRNTVVVSDNQLIDSLECLLLACCITYGSKSFTFTQSVIFVRVHDCSVSYTSQIVFVGIRHYILGPCRQG